MCGKNMPIPRGRKYVVSKNKPQMEVYKCIYKDVLFWRHGGIYIALIEGVGSGRKQNGVWP